MWSSDSDRDESVSTTTTAASSPSPSSSLQPQTPPPPRRRRNRNRRRQQKRRSTNGAEGEDSDDESPQADAEQVWCGVQWEAAWPRRAKPVVLAGEERSPAGTGSAGAGDPGVGRARSLTDDDLEELKGCVDLGFGFSYNEIPELCGTLPALELCYSMSQRFLDEHHSPAKPEQVAPEPPAVAPASPAQTIPNWKISCPGDSPDEVKARLKYWAQAVACTVKLCS